MKKHEYTCPKCGRSERCSSPAECAKAKTRDVKVLCETCAQAYVRRTKEHR